MRYALELQGFGLVEKVFPIMIGDYVLNKITNVNVNDNMDESGGKRSLKI